MQIQSSNCCQIPWIISNNIKLWHKEVSDITPGTNKKLIHPLLAVEDFWPNWIDYTRRLHLLTTYQVPFHPFIMTEPPRLLLSLALYVVRCPLVEHYPAIPYSLAIINQKFLVDSVLCEIGLWWSMVVICSSLLHCIQMNRCCVNGWTGEWSCKGFLLSLHVHRRAQLLRVKKMIPWSRINYTIRIHSLTRHSVATTLDESKWSWAYQ